MNSAEHNVHLPADALPFSQQVLKPSENAPFIHPYWEKMQWMASKIAAAKETVRAHTQHACSKMQQLHTASAAKMQALAHKVGIVSADSSTHTAAAPLESSASLLRMAAYTTIAGAAGFLLLGALLASRKSAPPFPEPPSEDLKKYFARKFFAGRPDHSPAASYLRDPL